VGWIGGLGEEKKQHAKKNQTAKHQRKFPLVKLILKLDFRK
jgi:hypothetical protein